MEKQKKNEAGITLIALVISIIVMLILAGISINATVGDNGILKQAQLATISNKFAGYKEQFELNALDDEGVYASGQAIKNYIPNMEDLDIEKFVIMKRNLMYLENDELEIQACINVGIQTADTGEEGSASAISEVKAIISGVVDLASNEGENFEVPEDDFDTTVNTNNSSEGLIGIRLFDKESRNDKTWNIVIEYNSNNEEIARYGSGYYWLKAGETYIINDKSMNFENDFIIDYVNKKYIVLSGRAVNWNFDSTIAVSTGLVLNIDPMSLADGEWRVSSQEGFYDWWVIDSRTGKEENKYVRKTGDVVYSAPKKALEMNEDTENNPKGIKGWLEINSQEVNFNNGFTFEFYGKALRLFQTEGDLSKNYGSKLLGIFCKTDKKSNNNSDAMRFCYSSTGFLGDFCDASAWTGTGMNVKTAGGGDLYWLGKENFINENEDFYLTVVYKRNFSTTDEDYEIVTNKKLDRIDFYINGELKGYTYYHKDSFQSGLDKWSSDECPFQIGRCPINDALNFNYFKGDIYNKTLYNSNNIRTGSG